MLELEDTESFKLKEVVHDGDEARARSIRRKFNFDPHQNFEEALDRNTALCIVTPDRTHPRLVKKALEAGLDVFVEKPLAFDVEVANQLYKLAESSESLLMPGHLMLYHPVREALESEPHFQTRDLDEILISRLNNLRHRNERRLLHSSLIHDVSLLDVLFQQRPESISIHETLGPYPPGRFLEARLDYDPTSVHVRVRTDWPFDEREVVLRNDDHYFRFDGIEETMTVVNQRNEASEERTAYFDSLPLTRELQNFVRSVRGGEECEVSRDHVLRVMETLDSLQDKCR